MRYRSGTALRALFIVAVMAIPINAQNTRPISIEPPGRGPLAATAVPIVSLTSPPETPGAITGLPGVLAAPQAVDLEAFRNEIRESGYRYAEGSAREWAKIEVSKAPEAALIPTDFKEASHVMYLGAGMDVLRPLVDFPTARHIHLVDGALLYYENLKGEISARLQSLSQDAKIEMADPGYFSKRLKEQLEALEGKERAYNSLRKLLPNHEAAARSPMVLKASWTSRSLGKQERLIYLHPLEYRDAVVPNPTRAGAETMTRIVPKEAELAGVMVFGAPLPAWDVLAPLLKRLSLSGIMATSIFHHAPYSPDHPALMEQHMREAFASAPGFVALKIEKQSASSVDYAGGESPDQPVTSLVATKRDEKAPQEWLDLVVRKIPEDLAFFRSIPSKVETIARGLADKRGLTSETMSTGQWIAIQKAAFAAFQAQDLAPSLKAARATADYLDDVLRIYEEGAKHAAMYRVMNQHAKTKYWINWILSSASLANSLPAYEIKKFFKATVNYAVKDITSTP